MKRLTSESGDQAIAVSAGGQTGRHVRVQIFDAAEHVWRRHASFIDSQAAEAVMAQLAKCGHIVRMVRYGFCPTAR